MVLNLILAVLGISPGGAGNAQGNGQVTQHPLFSILNFSPYSPFKLVNAGAPSQRAGERTPPPSGGALFAPDAAREVIAFPCYFMRRMV